MKRYSVTDLRAHLAVALDEAEKGETVVVERRGRRFRLVPEAARAAWPAVPARIEILDPAIVDGEWGWEWPGSGQPLAFVAHEKPPSFEPAPRGKAGDRSSRPPRRAKPRDSKAGEAPRAPSVEKTGPRRGGRR